ncbi:hypothetical protein EsDP_00004594 [Epichloe bromicola]|uniref:ERCC4 domain-containing protein n=1 Tax=Epichloe bromicola TaxID=79588 RepID=A0ABQ0CS55_9HYPO
MAPDVIDLISSSPRLSDRASSPCQDPAASSVPAGLSLGHDAGTKSPSAKVGVKLTDHNKPPNNTRSTTEHCTFDDMDDDIFDLLEEPQTKRRKTVGSNIGHKKASEMLEGRKPTSNAKHLPLTSHDRSHLKRPVLEPIEFTSSLEQTSPKQDMWLAAEKQLPPSSKYTRPSHGANTLDLDDPFRSDPFDSSPQPVSGEKFMARRAASLDPFVTSSPPQVLATGNLENVPKSYGSGQSKRRHIEGRQGCESDPFASSPTSEQRTTSKAPDDLICIDESSDNSHCSNDDDLPSIMDMDLSKRRARSPMRRTQSDTTWANRIATRETKPRRRKKTAAEREADRGDKRREREQQRAAKAAEKHRVAALAEVNKLRTDKKVSAPEMIVDLPSGLNTGLAVQVKEMLQGLGVEHATWSCPNHNVIKWRRKVTSRFNDEMGLWEPITPRIAHEAIVIVIVAADEFVSLVLEDGLGRRIIDIQSQHARKKLVFLLQGMTTWIRKNRSNRNRQFTSGVRSAGGGPTSTSASASKPRAAAEYVSEDVIEDAMLSLHVEHGILVHHTTVPTETARWVVNFTQHISTIPYKKQRDHATSVAGFCMESGQVRTGDTAQDTYVRMLQEIVRITAPIAYGIAAEFNSVTKLAQGLDSGGPERLASVRKSTNKDGAVSDRTVGQAVSRRVHKVFTGTDEDSTDV